MTNPTRRCFLKKHLPWPGVQSCRSQFVYSVVTLFFVLSPYCLDHKPPLQSSISAGDPSQANCFKIAPLQKGMALRTGSGCESKSRWIDETSLTYTPWPLNHARSIKPCSSAVRFSSHLTWLDPCFCPVTMVPCLCSNQPDRCSCYRPLRKLRRLLLTVLFCRFDI